MYYQAFKKDILQSYLDRNNIEAMPLPPRRDKNVIESKHRIITDSYIRLQQGSEHIDDTAACLMVQQALRISKDLYGNDAMCANELAKLYTLPIYFRQFPAIVLDGISKTQKTLMAKKLTKF